METLQRTANRGSISTASYDIDNSIKFETANTESLTKSQTASNRKTWTLSFWFKRTKVDADLQYTFQANVNSSTVFDIVLNGITDWRISDYASGSRSLAFYSTVPLRDPSAWYHVVIACDTTQGTAANRFKVYLNGVDVTAISGYFSTASYPAEDYETNINNSAATLSIGKSISASTNFCGYIAEVNFIDGLMKDEEDFGKFDSASGIWQPIEYTGSYGNEGYYLDFADSGDLGDDESGNGKDFTENNITAADQSTDTPTNNFATFNPLNPTYASSVISEGSTKIVSNGAGTFDNVQSTMAVTKGKWYCEMEPQVDSASRNTAFGVVNLDSAVFDASWYNNVGFWGAGFDDGRKIWYYFNGGQSPGNTGNGSSVVVNYGTGSGDTAGTIGMAFDLDNGTLKFYIRNTQTSIAASSIPSGTYAFFADVQGSGAPYLNFNFGGYTVNSISSAASDANGYGTFEYAPPSGYYALCTKNLAEYG